MSEKRFFMAELFDKGRTTIAEHIQNTFKEEGLDKNAVCREFRREEAVTCV